MSSLPPPDPNSDDLISETEESETEQLKFLSEKVAENAKLAVDADRKGETDFAFYRYIDAIEALKLLLMHVSGASGGTAVSANVPRDDGGARMNDSGAVEMMKRMEQYLTRAEELKQSMNKPAVIRTEDGNQCKAVPQQLATKDNS